MKRPNQTRWNRWDLISETLSAAIKVDVVVSHYNDHQSLELTLDALATQSYPLELVNVIIADDGSETKPEVPADHPWNSCIVASQPDQGFRLAAVRNLGASRGTSPVIVFLDCDAVPGPDWLEQHMKWHRRSTEAVTFGKTLYVDADQTDFDQAIGRAPMHILGHLLRTNNLLSGHDDLFYAAAGGNLAVSRSLFQECGGFDEDFSEWGGEDLDLVFRLFTVGADLIPVAEAAAYHLGPGTSQSLDRTSQRDYLGHYIPHRSLKVPTKGRKTADIQVDVSVLAEQEQMTLANKLSLSLDSQRFKLVTDKHFPDLDTLSPLQIKTATSDLPINQIDRLVAVLGGQHAIFEVGEDVQAVTTRAARKTHRQTGSLSLYAIAKLYGQLNCSIAKVSKLDSSSQTPPSSRSRLRKLLGRLHPKVFATVEPVLRNLYAVRNQARASSLTKKIEPHT